MDDRCVDLKCALDEWFGVPFPENSDNEELSDIHTDLVMYDNDVVGCASSLIGGVAADLSWLEEDYDLPARLERFLADCTDRSWKEDAEAYRTYLQGLKRLAFCCGNAGVR